MTLPSGAEGRKKMIVVVRTQGSGCGGWSGCFSRYTLSGLPTRLSFIPRSSLHSPLSSSSSPSSSSSYPLTSGSPSIFGISCGESWKVHVMRHQEGPQPTHQGSLETWEVRSDQQRIFQSSTNFHLMLNIFFFFLVCLFLIIL